MSRRIKLRYVNVVLWVVIAAIVAIYWPQVKWSFKELPRYLSGHIGAPEERQMYRRARSIILEETNISPAKALLERAVAIDPNCEGAYWLARYHFELREDDRAIELFERYLEIDPMIADTYLRIATAHERQGRPEMALDALRRGHEHFSRVTPLFKPRPLLEGALIDPKFNQKANATFVSYSEAATMFLDEIERLEP